MLRFRRCDRWSERTSEARVMFCSRDKRRSFGKMLAFAHAINGEASAKCWLDFPAGNLRLAIGKLTASSTEKRILDVDGISKARNRNPLVPVARGIFRAGKTGRELSFRGGADER